MKIERTREWWARRAEREDGHSVAAGVNATDPRADRGTLTLQHTASQVAHVGAPTGAQETRLAFGRFVNLMRRQKAMSIEQLAEAAALEVGELISIEDDLHFTPEPRTVFQLAQAFRVPQHRMMQLAGLATAEDRQFRQEAIRFAARSESMQRLTKEEQAALTAFIGVLGQ